MGKTKSLEEKKRDKRIQKQVENLGGSKKTPQPKTLKQATDEQSKRARLMQMYPFTSGDKKGSLAKYGFKPATTDERVKAMLTGSRGVYEYNVPKELRDRLKYEKVYTKGSGSRKVND